MVTRSLKWRGVGLAAAVLAATAFQAGAAQGAAAVAVPQTVAASDLQNLINTVRGETGTYAGLWIDRATNTVYVSSVASSVTSATVAGLARGATASVRASSSRPTPNVLSGTSAMKIQVVHAKYSFADLETIDGKVMHDGGLQKAAKASGAVLSEWYPDPVTDKVVIGFTKVTPAEVAAVQAEYGTTARVITQQVATAAIAKVPASSAKSVSSPNAIRANSRTADSTPWYGGDQISFTENGTGYICTLGYKFGSSSMSTAGHCGGDPTTFYNNGVFVGTTYSMQWGDNRIDMQLLNGSSYSPYVWAGSNGATPEPVSGSGGVADGGQYCTDGSVNGQNCTAVVQAVDVCVDVTSEAKGTAYVCDLDEATSADGTRIIRPGDSGGPVYTSGSTSDPYAVGTISATNLTSSGTCGCTTGYWSDMYMEKEIFGTSPAIG